MLAGICRLLPRMWLSQPRLGMLNYLIIVMLTAITTVQLNLVLTRTFGSRALLTAGRLQRLLQPEPPMKKGNPPIVQTPVQA